MGYDIHITRKEQWFDEKGENIELEEWLNFVKSSSDMRHDGFAEAETPNGTLRIDSEGLSVWLGYSGHEKNGNMAWFYYSDGNIQVKNPDEEILKKMYKIAQELQAKVQGDDCEIYDENGQSNWKELSAQDESVVLSHNKKWWRFWK